MFALDEVVPWGRSFDEYRRMFALTHDDLGLRVLGCADGPASFNAEATRRGARVVSADPLYRWSRDQIADRIAVTSEDVLEQTRRNSGEFVWDDIRSVEELGRIRRQAMSVFLDDYDAGSRERRYVEAALPSLPFPDRSFDLALCSHFLFLYSEQLGPAFHRAAALELSRVARDVRVFPLLALGGRPSPHLGAVTQCLEEAGASVAVQPVPYEFQRGANRMLRVTRPDAGAGLLSRAGATRMSP